MRKCAHFSFIRQDDLPILCDCFVSSSDAHIRCILHAKRLRKLLTSIINAAFIIFILGCHSYFLGIIYANSNGVRMSNEPLPLTICIPSHSTVHDDDRHLSSIKNSVTLTTDSLSGRHFKFSPKHLRELLLHEEMGKKVHNLWRNTQRYIKTSVPSLHAAAISYLDVQLIEHLCMLPHASTRLT